MGASSPGVCFSHKPMRLMMDPSTEVTDSVPLSANHPAVPTSAPSSQPPANISAWGLSRADQWFVGTLLTAGLVLLTIFSLRQSRWGTELIEIKRQTPLELAYQLDINTANWVEWAQLEGIGPNVARKIVADREKNGPFKSVDDLTRVNGIGEKTVARLRPQLTCSTSENASAGSSTDPQHRSPQP